MQLPDSVRGLLWEYDLDNPKVQGKLEHILMERVMARGEWDSMSWLLNFFGREKLRAFLMDRGHRVLAARELRFWSWVCQVPESVARDWVGRARAREMMWRG